MSCSRSAEVDIPALLKRQDSAECLDFLRHCDQCDDCADAVQRHSRSAGSHSQGSAISPRLAGAIGGAALAMLLVGLGIRQLTVGGEAEAPVAPPEGAAVVAEEVGGEPPLAAPPARPPYTGETIEEIVLVQNESIEIPVEALPKSGPVFLAIQLPVASTTDDPRPVRIIMEGREPLETVGRHEGGDRNSARVEIESGWLDPGRYLVEIRTTEMTHLPLRRYVLEVR